jgi:hypothetical protein
MLSDLFFSLGKKNQQMNESLHQAFETYHRHPGNVLCHVFTVTMGLIGMFGTLNRLVAPSWYAIPTCIYIVALGHELKQTNVVIPSASLLLFCAFWGRYADLSPIKAIGLLCAAYVLQDMSHVYYNEPTYQANTWGGGTVGWNEMTQFGEHVYYMIPLIISLTNDAWKHLIASLPLMLIVIGNYKITEKSAYGPQGVSEHTVIKGRISNMNAATTTMRNFIVNKNESPATTGHWWIEDISEIRDESMRISTEVQRTISKRFGLNYVVRNVPQMDELYTTPSTRMGSGTSDQVFETPHIDGPFTLFPFCTLYRTIVAITPNACISTHLSHHGEHKFTLTTGDYLGWDFNRESHFITSDPSKPNGVQRQTLKLHHVVYPKAFPTLGAVCAAVTTAYDRIFRRLFLSTISESSWLNKLSIGTHMVDITCVFNVFELMLGGNSILFYTYVGLVAWIFDSYAVFLYATSFVHYMRYISTYYHRGKIHYQRFTRDCTLFKSVSIAQLFILLFRELETVKDPIEHLKKHVLVVLAIFLGYSISMRAAVLLGKEGTFFGAELGIMCKQNFTIITAFPYGWIPHPMIVGQIIALGGLHVLFPLKEHPLLIPLHITLYCVHMTQEMYDIHEV